MERDEFVTWAAAIQTYFPRFEIFPNEAAMELWFRELQDIPADILTAALRKWVVTEKWPPSIAELRALCAEIVQGKAPDWGKAWGEVIAAIGHFGLYRHDEALSSMSPLTRKTVNRIGWRDMCLSENTDTLRAQFRQIYEICGKREVEDRQIPLALKEAISMISGSMQPLLKGKESHET